MKNKFGNMNDSYDDGNIPDIDIDPYEEKELQQNPKKNSHKNSYKDGEEDSLPESTRVRRDGPGGDWLILHEIQIAVVRTKTNWRESGGSLQFVFHFSLPSLILSLLAFALTECTLISFFCVAL